MNNAQKAQIQRERKRHATMLCQFAARLEEHGLPYTDIMARVATRKEYELIQRYVNSHIHYPDMNGGWDELEEE